MKGGWFSAVLPEVNDDLAGFLCVQGEVVLRTPGSQLQDLLPVGSLVTPGDQSDHCSVVSKLDDEVVFVGRSAVVGVEAVEEGAQHTALWGANAQHAGGGEVGAKSHSLGSVGQEVLNPGTCERGKAESVQFCSESIRDYCIEGRTVVHEEHPDVALLLLQVVQCRVESYGDGILWIYLPGMRTGGGRSLGGDVP